MKSTRRRNVRHRERLSHRRWLRFETMEARLPLTAEGQSHVLDTTVDSSAIFGDVSGTIQWGDGTSSVAPIASKPSVGPLKVRIDYSLDSANFFQSTARRSLLQTALDSVASRFSDVLTAIQPSGSDQWTAKFLHPGTGADTTRVNMSIPANEIVVFVGGRAIGGAQGGLGDRGGYSVSSTKPDFVKAVQTRGQAGALANPSTDVGPWGGSIAFDTTKNWYFGTNPNTIPSNQLDFVSVATHEFFHVLGFGTSNSFNNKIVNSRFVGAKATQEYGASVPMGDADHFRNDILYQGKRPMMVSEFVLGQRSTLSRLDLAALQDTGWQLIVPNVRISAAHVYGDNGNFPVSIVLQGSKLGTQTSALTIPITNTPPTFVNRSNATAVAGQSVTLQRIGQFTDPGFGIPGISPPKAETFTYRIQWGDNTPSDTGNATVEAVGSPTGPTRGFFNGTHTYASAGTYTVTLTATDDDGGASQQSFQMVVSPPPVLNLTINRASFSEAAGAGAATLTLSRPAAFATNALVVSLLSKDTTEVGLPASATLAAGVTSIQVGVNAVDDALFDGTQRVELIASATGFQPGSLFVDVLDYQPISLASERTTLHEDIPAQRSTPMTISLRSPAPAGGVTVQLSASAIGVLAFPASATIPAGATQTSVTVAVVDDFRPIPLRSVTITASGSNLVSASRTFTILDSDPQRWTNPTDRFDVTGNGTVDPLDVLVVINEINRGGSRLLDPILDTPPPFYDSNPDGSIDPLDVLAIVNEINRR